MGIKLLTPNPCCSISFCYRGTSHPSGEYLAGYFSSLFGQNPIIFPSWNISTFPWEVHKKSHMPSWEISQTKWNSISNCLQIHVSCLTCCIQMLPTNPTCCFFWSNILLVTVIFMNLTFLSLHRSARFLALLQKKFKNSVFPFIFTSEITCHSTNLLILYYMAFIKSLTTADLKNSVPIEAPNELNQHLLLVMSIIQEKQSQQ